MTLDERNLVDDIIMNVRIAADAIGLTDGAVAVCVHDFMTRDSFDELVVAQLSEDGDYCLYEQGALVCDCYGVAMMKLRAAQAAYLKCEERWCQDCVKYYKSASLDSADEVPGRTSWNGAVCYPIVAHDYTYCMNGGRLAQTITVAVSGGTEKQDAALAWSVEAMIRAHAERNDCWLDIRPDYEHRIGLK